MPRFNTLAKISIGAIYCPNFPAMLSSIHSLPLVPNALRGNVWLNGLNALRLRDAERLIDYSTRNVEREVGLR